MTNNIALCGIQEELARTLEYCVEYCVLRFFAEPERRGDVKLAYFLRDGPLVDLAVVGYPGAEGLAACDYLRTQNHSLPILWLWDRREFEQEGGRLGVTLCDTESQNAGVFDCFCAVCHSERSDTG
ncbi:hypothetical protein V6615_06565 [Oscillospiraceae bacterium PP1C4]